MANTWLMLVAFYLFITAMAIETIIFVDKHTSHMVSVDFQTKSKDIYGR